MNPPSCRARQYSLICETLKAHGPILLAIARRLAGDPTEAADLYQDVVEIALWRAPRAISSAELRAWMLVVLRNRFYDLRRHQKTARRLYRNGEVDTLRERLHGESDQHAMWKQVDHEDLWDALTLLPPSHREPVTMWLGGSSLAEIGRQLGIEPSTAGTRLHRARAKLRRILEGRLSKRAA